MTLRAVPAHARALYVYCIAYFPDRTDCSVSDLLIVPLGQAQRAVVLLLDPVRDTVEVEGVIAAAPGDIADSVVLGHVRHAMDTVLHEVVMANSALVLLRLPLPHDNSIPLFNHVFRLSCLHFLVIL